MSSQGERDHDGCSPVVPKWKDEYYHDISAWHRPNIVMVDPSVELSCQHYAVYHLKIGYFSVELAQCVLGAKRPVVKVMSWQVGAI